MNKEQTLFAVLALVIGLAAGFFLANSINKDQAMNSSAEMPQFEGLPPGHMNPARGTVPEVQAAIERARQAPADFEAQMKAAELYYQIQRFPETIEFLEKANALQPDKYEVIVNLGNANLDAGKYEESEKWYSAAIKKRADDVNVRSDLGLTFIFRDPPDYSRAVQEFERVLETDQNHLQALQNLAVAYTRRSEPQKAKEMLERLTALDASNTAIPKLRQEIANLPPK